MARTDEDKKLEHVLRPQPPWREENLTECGLEVGERPIITRDAFLQKVKDQGQQRSALTTCMTCWHTALRQKDWNESPSDVMLRDVTGWHEERKNRLNGELQALAALVAAHPEEFYGYIEGLHQTVQLDARRRRRARR